MKKKRNVSSRFFAGASSHHKSKHRTRKRPSPPPPESDLSAEELRERLKEAKKQYGAGEITQDELYAVADQYLAVVNKKQKELAIKHEQRYRKIKRADIIRDV